MRVDLHNHTIYCNHASGSMEEYIQRAMALGIDIFGFSCHAPMDFDTKYRMSKSMLPTYLSKIEDLSTKYSDKITILSALEVDFILGREDLLLGSVLDSNVDYLIGSVHFLGEWGFDNPEFVGEWSRRGVEATWALYLDSVQKMAETKLFNIMGHFDLPKLFGSKIPKNMLQKVTDTLEILHKNDLVIEINAAGLRKKINEQYPSLEILKIAKEIGIDITFSSDAHAIEQVGSSYETCLKIAKSVGYTKAVYFTKKEKKYVEI